MQTLAAIIFSILGAPQRRIVGIALVRDDDLLVERAIRNVLGFCDQMFLVDHRSRDETPRILSGLAASEPTVSLQRVKHPRESHDLIKEFAGSPTWIFGVDGDEIYDPRGLPAFRARVLAGEFDDVWFIKGNVLHFDGVDVERREATGWLAPPARSITKLFNFAAIDSWEGDTPERLEGGAPAFRPGYDGATIRWLRDEYAWEASPFRCLHACFLPRSSRDDGQSFARRSFVDRSMDPGWARALGTAPALGFPEQSQWKSNRYRQGERTTVDATGFFD